MVKKEFVVGNDYCYNLVNPLIDYKGDIAKGNKNDMKVSYSADFSPNNIRRLIISGDGVVVNFHIKVGNSLSKVKSFSDTDKARMVQCLYMDKYKPMLWVLAERVCSSVEEVIICTKNKGSIDLSRELDFSGLLKNKNGVSDIKSAIMQRYPRLAYFTIVNCDIVSLRNNPEVLECTSPYKLISETNFVKSNSSSITHFRDDWYNNYGHHSVYSLDKDGSPLNNHFKEVKADFEKMKKDKALAEIKSNRLKEVSNEFDKTIKMYAGVYTCIKNLGIIIQSEGLNYISKDINRLNVKLLDLPDKLKEDFTKLTDKNDCSNFIKNIRNSSTIMYTYLSQWFFDSILKLKSDYPITVDILLSSMDRRIAVPPNCQNIVEQLGISFEGKNMASSVANICAYSCCLFITDVGEHNMTKYYDKSHWLKYFEGGNQ